MPAITSVGIATKDRLASLERVLTGYIDNARTFGKTAAFVVIDGSSSPRTRRDCRRMLRSLRDRWAVKVYYAGPEEKGAFAQALAGAGLARETARFALFGTGAPGCTVGADRNALLLHTAGELIFHPDDDVHCRVAPAPGKRKGSKFSRGFNPEEFWFFQDAAAARRGVRFQEEDVLGLHEEFLGRELPGRGKVLATSNGLVGDCALVSPRPYLRLQGSSRRRLTASRSHYERALSRQVIRVVTRNTAGKTTSFFTSAVGLDNRALLAPFMPMFRNEDGLFGVTLDRCFPRGRLVQLPWALLHEPPEPRTFRGREFRRSPAPRANDVAHLLVTALEPAASGGERGLRALAGHLEALAADPADFRRTATHVVHRARALQLLHMERLLKSHEGVPGYWAADVAALRDGLERSLGDELPAPRELGWDRFRRLVLRFATLSRAWPDLTSAAKELRAKGVRLAVPA